MEYYKDCNGRIYLKLTEAEHAETGEKMIVYQEMSGKGKVQVLPETIFFDENRFTEIEDGEAQNKIPLELNPKYHFPDLQYENRMHDLMSDDELSKPVKAMITLLLNKGIVKNNFFKDIKKDDDLEELAIKRISEYSESDDTEQIFHLIQTWGGSSGRGIYIFGSGYNWENIAPHYQNLVKVCLSIKDTSHDSIDILSKAIHNFDHEVHNLGIAFITKHTRFWLTRNLGNNALPIYDSIMANFVMRRKSVELKHLVEYWNVMIAKSKQLGIDLMPLERQIFKYASDNRNNPTQ